MTDPRFILITGQRQVGKSTALQQALLRSQEAGLQVSGLLTQRVGPHDLMVTELHTGATYPLTDPFEDRPGSPTRQFAMNAQAFARSRRALEASFPTQLFVLDEVGPLELRHHQGWWSVFGLLRCREYDQAVIVVRPELLGEAIAELPGICFSVVRVSMANRDTLPAVLFEMIQSGRAGAREREPHL
ncbi:MAG: nucleoside-triphosphatase [Anaerolineae bacterium]